MVLGIASGRHAGMVVAAAVLALAGRAAGQSVVAGPVTNAQFGARYWLVSAATWQAARDFAPTLDPEARLVSVDSLAENDWIGSQFAVASGSKMFIGLSVLGSPAVQAWADGSASAFRNWSSGQPSGTGYAVLVTANASRWQVEDGDYTPFAVVRAPIDVRVPQDFASIQGAVNAVRDGRTVRVEPGTYGGFSATGRRITVRGIGGSGQTVISGSGVSILSTSAPGMTLQGFTIRDVNLTAGAALVIQGATATVRDVVLRDNRATASAGFRISGSSSVRFERCRFTGNQATSGAGGRITASTAAFIDCLWSDNAASIGSAMVVDGSTLNLVNCTVAGNSGFSGDEIVFSNTPTVRMRNCVVSDGLNGPAVLDIAYSNILGGAPGVGNIDMDPRFEPTLSATGLAYRLRADSPCVDAGNLAEYLAVSSGVVDLEGGRRAVDVAGSAGALAGVGGSGASPRIDMGALEFQPALEVCRGDFDGSGSRGVSDIFAFLSAWFAGCP